MYLLTCLSPNFFFLGSRVHRDLHSFPTRRSSDLSLLGPGAGLRSSGLTHLRLDAAVRRIDRKSTRLNSSHVAISYAVFCLKKKNTCNIDVVNHFVDLTPQQALLGLRIDFAIQLCA